MSVIQIQGGRPLSGSVRIQGAKNSVLPLLAATLLSRGTCVLRNCPKLTDVDHTIDILRSLGCRVEREGYERDALLGGFPGPYSGPDGAGGHQLSRRL